MRTVHEKRRIGFRCLTPLHFLLVCFFLTILHPAGTQANDDYTPDAKLFPLPKVLRPNVEFWIKIYAVYPSNKVLIHDNEDLEVIYEVVDFYDLFADPESVSERTKWKKIEKIKKNYKKRLETIARKLAKKQPLTAEEDRLRQLFKPSAWNPKRLRRAARRIRGQLGLKDRFLKGLQRSGQYIDKIRATLKAKGLPLELAYMPHVESEFNYRAYSKVGAAGLWQFTRGTGRRYLKINYDIDERFDPVQASESAAKLLKNNYRLLGSWPLALTAYNHGPNGMKRARRKFGSDIGKIVRYYRSRSFGFASRNFYAEFLAATHVATHFMKYFGQVDLNKPIEYETFKTDKYYSVRTVLKTFDMTLTELKAFNPALRRPVLRGERRIPRNYYLHIPRRPGVDARKLWASISPAERFKDQIRTGWYKVRRGDNMSLIARRVGLPMQMLIDANGLVNAHRIYVGQILKIPQKSGTKSAKTQLALVADARKSARAPERPAPAKETRPEPAPIKVEPAMRQEVVSPADDGSQQPPELFEPSNGLATPEGEVAPPNMRVELASGPNGGFMIVPAEEPTPSLPASFAPPTVETPISEWITVEPEETLGHYAEWLEVSAKKLRKLNKLPYGREIQIGQKLHLTYAKVSPQEFMRRRLEYQQSIEEDFFAAWRVEGVRLHTVKRGQSIWYITNTLYDLPLWLVSKYNPGKDLQDLHIGDQINIPIVSQLAD